MKSLCINQTQRDHLLRLVKLIREKELNGMEAWSAFSVPNKSKVFTRNKKHWATISFNAAEVKSYKDIRRALQKWLFEKCSGSCSYCRRPVGHYGWAWNIEHMLPKSKYPARTFDLANLTVGCVHCNQWKGRRVDPHVVNMSLPIIHPVSSGFVYSRHLTYVQIGTESLCFSKYATHSPEGLATYDSLSFSELERVYAINGMHAASAALHERITRAMGVGLSKGEGQEFVKLLGDLRSAIYRIPG